MIPSASSPATTSPTDTHQNGMPVRKLCVPSIGSITQIAAASGLREPALLAEEAVLGKPAGQAARR